MLLASPGRKCHRNFLGNTRKTELIFKEPGSTPNIRSRATNMTFGGKDAEMITVTRETNLPEGF